MLSREILDDLRESYPDCLTADGFDDAIMGIVVGACRQPVVCYDYRKCVEILMERDGMDEETAEEFLEFNTNRRLRGGDDAAVCARLAGCYVKPPPA